MIFPNLIPCLTNSSFHVGLPLITTSSPVWSKIPFGSRAHRFTAWKIRARISPLVTPSVDVTPLEFGSRLDSSPVDIANSHVDGGCVPPPQGP
ncbi:hypothetical protein PanWU01x14_169030 [Parasponia andersonii]|uniref:Uncharacterized protein n=1 Tax=Parasponia andersonii TaxID=3476 RepID=A0A2P5CAR0_PARAD|nr:hypothetical protein PanWU01x14_169030 [Parasponia andersonii]